MSLVEQLFPPAELAALKEAVLATIHEREAEFYEFERQGSTLSHQSTDSGYNSDFSTPDNTSTHELSLPPSYIYKRSDAERTALPNSSCRKEKCYTEVIDQARAQLYSNTFMSWPSIMAMSPVSLTEDPSQTTDEHYSPVSVEPVIATESGSGFGIDTFTRLGLATTSHERDLLKSLAVQSKPLPATDMDSFSEQKTNFAEPPQQYREQEPQAHLQEQQPCAEERRQCSYHGFTISCNNDEEGDSD